MRALLTVMLFLSVGAPSGTARAQASLIMGLGGAADLGEIMLPGIDDEDAIVDVTPVFSGGMPFYGMRFNNIYVSENGLVSLGGPRRMAPRAPMPATGNAFIAAWAYDMYAVTAPSPPGANQVYVDVGGGRVVVTWYLVQAAGGDPTALVTTQLVLTPSGASDTAIEFRFVRCDWSNYSTDPTMPGLLPLAQAGIDRGTEAPTEFVALPGSGTDAVRNLCTTSNVGMNGVYRYTAGGAGIAPTCGNGLRETGEACDDGNTMNGDSCTSTCTDSMGPVCGNNLLEPPEQCDDGDMVSGDGCSATCMTEVLPVCGDGNLDMTEECDDGNTSPRDGCDGDCMIERAPDGGMPLIDAGQRDGGGTGRILTVGGGGCNCRASSRGGSSRALGLLISLLGIARLRRSRGRAPR